MDVIVNNELASKGFWAVRNASDKGRNLAVIKKKRNGIGEVVYMLRFHCHQFPHPTGTWILKKGTMVDCLSFDNLADAKSFAVDQLKSSSTKGWHSHNEN
jgi:hypothetical protein